MWTRSPTSPPTGPTAWQSCGPARCRSGIRIVPRRAVPGESSSRGALPVALAPLLATARAGARVVSAAPRLAGRRLHLRLCPTVAGCRRRAAWLAGLVFGLGGFTLARVENINQLNVLAWLPALLWTYDETARARGGRSRVRWASPGRRHHAAISGQTHADDFYERGRARAVGALAVPHRPEPAGKGSAGARGHGEPGTDDERPARLRNYLLPLLAVIPAILVAAAQLLPTLELNGLGLARAVCPIAKP